MASGWTRQAEEKDKDEALAEGQETVGAARDRSSSWWGKAKGEAGGKSEEAKEKGSQVKDQAGDMAGKAKDQTSGAAEQAKDKASGAADQAKDKASGAAEQAKDKASGAAEQVKGKGQEVWESDTAQQARSQASEYGQKAGDAARKTKDTVGEGGHQFMTEIKEEGEGQGPGGELGRRTKQAGRAIHDKAQELAENPEARHNLAEDAGRFLGAMRAQGGGIGQEAEAFGRGAQMVSETAQQTWEHVPEEAKETVIRGGKKVAETTDRLWTKFFHIVERVLDFAEQKMFNDEDEEEDVEGGRANRGDDHAQPSGGGTGPLSPLLQKPGFLKSKDPQQKERERKQKEKEKKRGTAKLVSQVIGGFIALLLSTILLFFLGFFLLPILLIALLLLLLGFQCYACCGLRT